MEILAAQLCGKWLEMKGFALHQVEKSKNHMQVTSFVCSQTNEIGLKALKGITRASPDVCARVCQCVCSLMLISAVNVAMN